MSGTRYSHNSLQHSETLVPVMRLFNNLGNNIPSETYWQDQLVYMVVQTLSKKNQDQTPVMNQDYDLL